MEYPFGRWYSEQHDAWVLVTTVTGFPYFYELINPLTNSSMGRHRLNHLENILNDLGYKRHADQE